MTSASERQFGEQGLAQAMDQLRLALATSTNFDYAFFECLSWIYALEQVHEKASLYINPSPPPNSLFKQECAKTVGGEKLLAIVWARTFAGHDLLKVAALHMARSGALGGGGKGMSGRGASAGPPIWVGESGLHSQNEVRNAPGRTLYKTHIEGSELLKPLEDVQAYLVSLPPI